ncbi:OmpA family protein [Mariniflexile sp.]|uniref:OmpA family protein n=1 Tax=Mariniflexile sp. TaxID=1979402 RepID=UPI00404858BC
MKKYLLLIGMFVICNYSNGQILKKLKDKITAKTEQKVDAKTDRTIDKSLDSLLDAKSPVKIKKKSKDDSSEENEATTGTKAGASSSSNLKVYSKFDFVPGSSILYFDNFEKDNIGETPLGWITSASAEAVSIEGLEGNWVKMASTSANHFIRSKKQSWGNNFTIEFDLLLIKNSYDPRIDINLINTGGNLVTDESILSSSKKPALNFSAILSGDNMSRASLYAGDKKLSDAMTESLPYSNTMPVHVSMCVQGKRFRMWWNDRKLYDLQAISEEYLPNQLGFSFYSTGGFDAYISNIRIAKDIPDTRAKFEEGKIVSNLLFFAGTSKLKPESMGALLDVSKVLKDVTSTVKIVGHTDADGDDASNLKLSEQRAETVKSILVNQFNINESKLETEGRGENQPIADNKSAEGKAQNRRVEFIFKSEADNYIAPSGVLPTSDSKLGNNVKNPSTKNTDISAVSGDAIVKLQSKILNINLPFAQIMKTGDNSFTFTASKEEGNNKENYFKIQLKSVNNSLKPETYNFTEIAQKLPLYGSKQYAEITDYEAVLLYGATQKPYIYRFSPIVANGTMASYVDNSLARHLPAPSPNCIFVIEKVENGKASGYFTTGIMIEGLKPVTKGDAEQQTFTDGFSGEMKCTFSNVPVY